MKVTTKIAAGVALLVGLFLLSLARDAALVRDLASSHRDLLEVRLAAMTSTLEVLRALELSEERVQKYFVTRDEAYADQLERLADQVEAEFARQSALALSDAERGELATLAERFHTYREAFAAHRGALHADLVKDGPLLDPLRVAMVARVEAVRTQAMVLLSTIHSRTESGVAQAQEMARTGRRESAILGGLAVLGAALFVGLTVRSLNRPLGRLIAATRAVAAGRFVKVEPRGRGELAELARAFDRMVDRLEALERAERGEEAPAAELAQAATASAAGERNKA